ncbi:MAG TPA: ferredoxin-NADP reductase [Thermoanaerobaculia bacterium]|nr:ferredoxin-NADP reductase [Thermoanaerobaculia bacterium]
MRIHDYDTSETYDATVVATERITPETSPEEVRELVLDVDRDDFPFEVGQSVAVIVPGDPAFGGVHHRRLYSVADLPERGEGGRPRIRICVKRCSYVDEYNGEEYRGVASHYLCDRAPGDRLTIAGPFGLAFRVPRDHDATLILIGMGTGIAPFRALVKHIYRDVEDWTGRVLLFHGALSGLELLYRNQHRDDFAQYYDEETFEAITALSPRPHWGDPIAWDDALESRGGEIWKLLGQTGTYVYVAGLESIRDGLDAVLSRIAGDEEEWQRRKAELVAGERWVELLY